MCLGTHARVVLLGVVIALLLGHHLVLRRIEALLLLVGVWLEWLGVYGSFRDLGQWRPGGSLV